MTSKVTASGAVVIGWRIASWPLATLKVDSRLLTLRVWPFRALTFARDEVVSFEKGSFFFVTGLRINHNISGCPKRIIFQQFGSTNKLIQRILQTGFIPSADPSSIHKRSSGFKWETVIGAMIIWGTLIYLDQEVLSSDSDFGPLSFVAVLSMFLISIFIRRSITLQNIFLKDGGDMDEVSDYINALTVFSGMMLLLGLLGVLR